MKKAFFSWMMVAFLVACVPIAQQEPTLSSEDMMKTAISTVSTTFAETQRVMPTATPMALPTLSPLPTFDFSATVVPTLIPTSFQTATLSVPTLGPGTPETECFITASEEGIQLRPGPSFSAYRLLPEMEPDVIYQAIDMHERYYQLALDGVPVGWVQYIDVFPTEGLSDPEGPGCDRLFARPRSRPLTEFPGLCLFTATSQTETFNDSTLTGPHFISLAPSSGPFVGLSKTRKSIFTLLSHAGPSFRAPLDKVSTSAACDAIPTSATVTTAGWLWSEPDEQMGEKLIQLPVGLRLHIEGDRPPDSSGEAAWVQAVVEGQPFSGWVWSALVSFD